MPKTRKTWFIRAGRYAQGPISSAELAQMARAGVLKPDAEISHAEDGPWRPARRIKGLVFPAPELPPLPKPQPFDSFADPVRPAPPQDAGILLEDPNQPPPPAPEPEPEPEPEPAVAFAAAPSPVPLALPAAASSPPQEQHPTYKALRVYALILRSLAIVSAVAGVVVLLLGVIVAIAAERDTVRVTAAGYAIGVALSLFVSGFLLLIPAEALSAFVDLVQDARRQRLAAERTAVLLESIVSSRQT
jgi:hypothetical protein